MNRISPITAKLLTLAMLKGVGPAALKRILQEPDLQTASAEALAQRLSSSVRPAEASTVWVDAVKKAADQIEQAETLGDRILSQADGEFPILLSATLDAPFFLFVRGHLSSTPDQAVAIIGTREPTPTGKKTAERITAWLVEKQWSIVSGLAEGCDGVAHQTALDHDGHTVAVLAHGLQTIYPASHKKLAADILANGGALVTEFPYGTRAIGPQFVKRDSTQAGLAQGVVMIQSDLTGGSLHASRAALRYGRWLAVPTPTSQDQASLAPKAEANRVLTSADTESIRALLKCDEDDLRRLVVLSGREDYVKLLERSSTSSQPKNPSPEQGSLL